jgi:hypothetical protein
VTAAEGQALALELGALWIETSSLTGSGGAHDSLHEHTGASD